MQRPYSMARSSWVPVRVRRDLSPAEQDDLTRLLPAARPGARVYVSPPEALRAARLLADFDFEHPPVESVARRVFAAFTARITGMDTRDGAAWHAARITALGEGFDVQRAEAYFAQHEARMRLFDTDRPVLQDPRLVAEVTSQAPPGRLVMNRPSGNNAVWDDRTPETVPVSPEDALGWLLAWRGYGPSGMVGRRSHGGRTSGTSSTAPYRGTVSYFPHGSNLLETLICSVPPPETWPTAAGDDLAPWESDQLPDPLHPAEPAGLVSLLTARAAHAVLLVPGQRDQAIGCYLTWASPGFLPFARDPYLVGRGAAPKKKVTSAPEELVEITGFLQADAERSAWRDLDKLLRPSHTLGKNIYRRPPVFTGLDRLDVAPRLGVRIVGWDQEGQDRNSAWYTATTPPVLRHFAEHDPERAEAALSLCGQIEDTAYRLRRALANAWGACNPGRKPEQSAALTGPAARQFWALAEREFWATLSDPQRPHRLQAICRSEYDRAAAHLGVTPRALEAVARERRNLAPKATKTATTS